MRSSSLYIILAISVFVAAVSFSFNQKNASLAEANARVRAIYLRNIQKLDSALNEYPKYFNDSAYATRLYKYQALLYDFKEVEGLFTYYYPKEAYETFMITPRFQQRDFGPPFPDNWLWIGPFGISPDSVLRRSTKNDSVFTKNFISRSVKNFRAVLASTNSRIDHVNFAEAEIFDALRLQMARISTIGLANGDMIVEPAAMAGLEGAVDSWCKTVLVYTAALPTSANDLQMRLQRRMKKAEELLDAKPAFKEFNRMNFLTEHLIPISKDFNALQLALKIPRNKAKSAFKLDAEHIYDTDAFDVDYFTPSLDAYHSAQKAELGKILFFDPILSDNNERTCASCHKPELAFTDGNLKSVGFERAKNLARNAPTVINAVFQKKQFWDLRATSLEDQLDSVINNRDELHSSFENVIDKIQSSGEYVRLFNEAFPETRKGTISRKHVTIAIASYERTLTGMNSRFDQYIRGDKSKLSKQEINGFNVFMGQAKCGSCHFAPLFNGALPPLFDSVEHRSLGIPVKDTMEVYEVDSDTGFSRVNPSPFLHFSFKVPTVRNVELTAPYMHNGVFRTLEQVVNFYDHAAGNKHTVQMRPGMKGLPFFMILPEELKLSEADKADLVLFMKALTDTTSSRNIPSQLPQLGGKYANLNKRKLGGEY